MPQTTAARAAKITIMENCIFMLLGRLAEGENERWNEVELWKLALPSSSACTFIMEPVFTDLFCSKDGSYTTLPESINFCRWSDGYSGCTVAIYETELGFPIIRHNDCPSSARCSRASIHAGRAHVR
jgi:hypothetical protein